MTWVLLVAISILAFCFGWRGGRSYHYTNGPGSNYLGQELIEKIRNRQAKNFTVSLNHGIAQNMIRLYEDIEKGASLGGVEAAILSILATADSNICSIMDGEEASSFSDFNLSTNDYSRMTRKEKAEFILNSQILGERVREFLDQEFRRS